MKQLLKPNIPKIGLLILAVYYCFNFLNKHLFDSPSNIFEYIEFGLMYILAAPFVFVGWISEYFNLFDYLNDIHDWLGTAAVIFFLLINIFYIYILSALVIKWIFKK